MGLRGPKTTLKPTKKGYMRRYVAELKRQKMHHVLIWESVNGPIPLGYQVHHIDEDKLNNEIYNLELLSPLEHKRLHSGCYRILGNWIKPCKKCGINKEIENNYYKRNDGISPWCKSCCVENAVKNKRLRKQLKTNNKKNGKETISRTS